MTFDKSDALLSLKPGAQWVMTDGVVTEWHDKVQTQPTDSEIETERLRLESEYAAKKYQRDRAAEYPSVVDQLDDIYHNGINGWKATIKAVKDKHPKPS